MLSFLYTNLFSISIFSFIITSILIKILIQNSLSFKLIDYPDIRKIHGKGIPVVGGIAIFLTFILYVFILFGSSIFSEYIYFFLSILFIFLLGLFDDMRGLSAHKKILLQFSASLLLVYGLSFNQFILFNSFGYYFNIFILVCFIFGICNSINLIDGIDGLAGCISIIILLELITFNIFFLGNLVFVNNILVALLGSLLAFILYNRYPAKIFLGDSGSLFLGWFFTAISLVYIKNVSSLSSMIASLIIVGVPAFDVLFVMKERFLNSPKKSLLNRVSAMFIPDNRHIHHLFIENGFSKKNTVMIVCLLNVLFCFTMFTYYYYWKLNNIYFILFILLVFYYFVRNSLIKKIDSFKYER